jgi:TolA-binding protein
MIRSTFRMICGVVSAGLLILSGGCVSTDLIQTMMKDIERLKRDNTTLREDVKTLNREVESLKSAEAVAGKATKAKESGGSALDSDGSEDFLANLSSSEEEVAPSVPAKPSRLSAEEVYANAQNLYSQSRYREAYQAFSQALFLDLNDDFQGRCYYWMGESMYAQGAFQQALDNFGKVFVSFGATSKAADALLKIGFTYYELGIYNGARQALNEFCKLFPDHRAVPLAKEKLSRIDEKESGKAPSDQ